MKKQELLRIVVPNFSAAAVVFSHDGQSIITAWNDGIIRAFTPLTGKLIYAISNAHNKGFGRKNSVQPQLNDILTQTHSNDTYIELFQAVQH